MELIGTGSEERELQNRKWFLSRVNNVTLTSSVAFSHGTVRGCAIYIGFTQAMGLY